MRSNAPVIGKVIQAAIAFGVKNDAVHGLSEGVGKEKMPKKCWGEHATLLNATLDWEGISRLAIIPDSLLHVLVGGYNQPKEHGGTCDLLQ